MDNIEPGVIISLILVCLFLSDFVFRKNWSGETRTLTTFVKGSYNTFDTGIVSDASLLPGANGKFDLYVPQDFGTFIGYSYVIDWEEYQ